MSSDSDDDRSQGRRRGRPPKSASELRSIKMTLHLNQREAAQLDANRGELDGADFLRLCAIEGKMPAHPVPRVNREEYIRLYGLVVFSLSFWLRSTRDESGSVAAQRGAR